VVDPRENGSISFRWPDVRGTAFFALVGLGVVWFGFLFPSDLRLVWIFLGLALLLLIVTVYFDPAQGTFRVDSAGIRQDSLLGKSRYLRWENVDRVKWRAHSCCLEGKDTSISIAFTPVSSKNVVQAKAFVEMVLSRHFDLSIKPVRQWSFDHNLKSFLAWLSKVIGISIAGSALFMAVFVGTLFLNQPWRFWLGLALFVLLLGIIFIWAGRASRTEQQINPAWRLRRKEER